MKYWRMRTEKEKNIHYIGIDEENQEKLFPYLFGGERYLDVWDSSVTICINEKKIILSILMYQCLLRNFLSLMRKC